MNHLQSITYTISQGIATVVIDRSRSLNALDKPTLEELDEVLHAIEQDDEAKIVVLTGRGDKAFVAGADIEAMRNMSPIEIEQFVTLANQVINRIENLDKVVIAAINGYALGGGFELSLGCDIRIASEKAIFGLPEVKIGIIPGFGGTQRLLRWIGETMTKEIIFTGKHLSAHKAKEIGIVNQVVPHDELMSTCYDLAKTITSNSPLGVKYAKKAINQGRNVSLTQGLAIEKQCFLDCFATEDRKEGMAAFSEKRKPNFQGK